MSVRALRAGHRLLLVARLRVEKPAKRDRGHSPRDLRDPRSLRSPRSPRDLSFDHFDGRVGLQREAAAAGRDNLHVGAFFLEAMAQQDEAALEVVLYRRQAERLGARGFFDKSKDFERMRELIAQRASKR